MITSFVIDRSKWRCGGSIVSDNGDNPNMRGIGPTCLLNEEGFMCCLGQMTKQILEAYNRPHWTRDLMNIALPDEVEAASLDLLSKHGVLCSKKNRYSQLSLNPTFVLDAITINDDDTLTDIQRERELERLGEKYGLRIEFTGEYSEYHILEEY